MQKFEVILIAGAVFGLLMYKLDVLLYCLIVSVFFVAPGLCVHVMFRKLRSR